MVLLVIAILCGLFVATLHTDQAIGQDRTLPILDQSSTTSATAKPDFPVEIGVRVVWGGAQARPFAGSLTVDQGTISVDQNLNIQPDAVDCVRATGPSSLEILPTSPATFGGADVLLAGTEESQLVLAFTTPGESTHFEQKIPFSQLLHAEWSEQLDERGTQVAVTRLVADRLRVDHNQQSLVFDVGESWKLVASGVLTGLSPGEYELRCKFVSASSVATIVDQPPEIVHIVTVDKAGSFAGVEWEWEVPKWEGTYFAEFTLNRKKFVPFLGGKSNSLFRRLEVVVLDSSARQPNIEGWHPLFSVDLLEASKPGNLNWLAPWRGWSTLSMRDAINMREMWNQVTFSNSAPRAPLSHGSLDSRSVRLDETKSNECLTISPGAWLALPITGLQKGTLHRLRVVVPTDQPLELATSVRSVDASGGLPALSRDSSIMIHERDCDPIAKQVAHEMLFWPAGSPAYVMLVNPSNQYAATVCQLDVERAIVQTNTQSAEPAAGRLVSSIGNMAPRGLTLSRESRPEKTTLSTTTATPNVVSQGRLAGLYLDKPILIDCFSAARPTEPTSGRELDSWSAWMEAIDRLELVMNWTNSNTLMMKVAAEGATIYPSLVLAPTLRYDSGTFFSDGRQPDIKDALELTLRRLDREGKYLIVALDIDANLPGLRNAAVQKASTLQRNLDGASRTTRDRPNVVRYNPLDPDVQAQLRLIVRELLDRYGHHPAFRGISIQLDRDSQFTFAGDRWGLDDTTLNRFAADLGIKLPARGQLERSLQGELRLPFLQWRAQQMAEFYRTLALDVKQKSPEAMLILNALRLWDETLAESDFWNVETVFRQPDEYLLTNGIDATRLGSIQGLMLLQGRLARNPQSVLSSDWMLDMSSARALRHQASSNQTSSNQTMSSHGAIVLQQPVGFQVEAIDTIGSLSAGPSSAWLFPFAAQHSDYARKPWIDQLYEADVQLMITGGWLAAGGQESNLVDFQKAFSQLPPVAMEDVAPKPKLTQNVRIRQANFRGKKYLQLINNSPWSERLKLEIQCTAPEKISLRDLVKHEPLSPLATEPGKQSATTWQLELRPFDLLALELSDADASLINFEHEPVTAVLDLLKRELDELEQAVAQSGDPTGQVRLAEIAGDFEQWTNDKKPRGWNVSSLPDINVARSSELPRSGSYSLALENRNAGEVAAWLQSEPIAVPRTRRLTMHAWLRQPTAGTPATVRLSVVGRLKNGERFERAQVLGGSAESRKIPSDWGHRPAALHVGDLPQDLEELQVAIDLIGPGKIWVDDVEVFESLLHPDERIFLRGQLLVARQALEQGNPFPAEKLLDSHWGKYIAQFHRSEIIEQRMAELPQTMREQSNTDDRANWNQSKPFFQQWRDTLRDRWRR